MAQSKGLGGDVGVTGEITQVAHIDHEFSSDIARIANLLRDHWLYIELAFKETHFDAAFVELHPDCNGGRFAGAIPAEDIIIVKKADQLCFRVTIVGSFWPTYAFVHRSA